MVTTTTQARAERNTDASVKQSRPEGCEPQLHVFNDLQCYTRQYVQQQPETAAMICLGIGFLLGWKLKPW